MKPILTVLFLLLTSTVFGQWIKLIENDEFTLYYYKPRTTRKGNIISTWVKIQEKPGYDNDTKEHFSKQFPEFAAKQDSYSYTIQKTQFDCSKQTFRNTGVVLYDTNDNAIVHYSDNTIKWDDVIPDSTSEEVMNALCSKIKQSK